VLARLRAKTDRELGILVVKQLHRARNCAGTAPITTRRKNS